MVEEKAKLAELEPTAQHLDERQEAKCYKGRLKVEKDLAKTKVKD